MIILKMLENRRTLALTVFSVLGLLVAFVIVKNPIASAWQNPAAFPPLGGGSFIIESGAPANTIYIKADGGVGIGTATPVSRLQINAVDEDYAFPNPGIAARGAIFIRSTTSDKETGITFGAASSNDAQAGIYVHQDGIAGTHMYLATTNSYAIGPQTRMTILNTGNVGIGTITPGAKLEVAGQVKITGGTPGAGKVLTSDADGLSSWAMPSSGGACALSGNDIVCNGIPVNSNGSLSITKNGVTCPIWKDCDGDGFTFGYKDCDENCITCYVGTTTPRSYADGKDQNCNGVIDELGGSTLLFCNSAPYQYLYGDDGSCLSSDSTTCDTACKSAGYGAGSANCIGNHIRGSGTGYGCYSQTFWNSYESYDNHHVWRCYCQSYY